MKIEKVLNNNVVVALDENGAETVLMGRGLGFGRRAGDEAPPDKVEKRFTLHSDQLSDRFQQLITSIPLPHFLMSERIINHAKIALGKELSDSIYVTLPDHISAAVNRYKEGIVLPNPLLWDIRQLYKDEFRVGLKANEIVKEETGVDVVVTDLVSVKSSRKVLTYANGDNTMYMDHLFICRPDPNGNTEPFVGDEESLSVGWFSPDALPEPLAATTVERMAYVREYLKAKANGDSHAQFAFNGTIR